MPRNLIVPNATNRFFAGSEFVTPCCDEYNDLIESGLVNEDNITECGIELHYCTSCGTNLEGEQ